MKIVPFDVVIPNSDRTAIARTVRTEVPVRVEDGIELLTPEAMEMIESTQRASMPRRGCPRCGKIEADGELHTLYRCEGAMNDLAQILKAPSESK